MLIEKPIENENIFCLYKYEVNENVYVCIERFSSFWWETRISVYLILPEERIRLTSGIVDDRKKMIKDLYNWLDNPDISSKYKSDIMDVIHFLESLYI